MVELKVTVTLEDLRKIVSEKVKDEFGECLGELDFSAASFRAFNGSLFINDIKTVEVTCVAGEDGDQ